MSRTETRREGGLVLHSSILGPSHHFTEYFLLEATSRAIRISSCCFINAVATSLSAKITRSICHKSARTTYQVTTPRFQLCLLTENNVVLRGRPEAKSVVRPNVTTKLPTKPGARKLHLTLYAPKNQTQMLKTTYSSLAHLSQRSRRTLSISRKPYPDMYFNALSSGLKWK